MERVNFLVKKEHLTSLEIIADRYGLSGNARSEIVRMLIEHEYESGSAEEYIEEHSDKFEKSLIEHRKKHRAK